jgi:hypothetical protein
MKRLVPLFVLFAMMFGSLGKAQSQGFGIYSGFPTLAGVQFQSDGFRAGVGLGLWGFGGDVALILAETPFAPGDALSWYYGAGVGGSIGSVLGVTVITVFPHGLFGVEWQVPQAGFSLYSELQLGAGIVAAAGTAALVPGFSGRIGIIFRP